MRRAAIITNIRAMPDKLMTYEFADESDPWFIEQHSFQKHGYCVVQRTLANGAEYPSNIDCCCEAVQLKLLYAPTNDEHLVNIHIVTVSWLEKELPKQPILYFKKAFIRRFFDYDGIQV